MSSRVLVIRGGAIGDFILTLPAIRLLRESLPDVRLEILGYPSVTRLAREAGIADAVRSIEYAGLADFFNPKGALDPDLMEYFASFDLVVSYLFDPDGYFQGNLDRCGVKTCLSCSHRVDESGDHAAHQLARPLESLALFLEDPAPRLEFPESLHREALELLEGSTPPLAMHPGSGSQAKNWPIESWIDLSDRLRETHPGTPLLIVTGEADEEHSRPLLAHVLREHSTARHLHAIDLPVLGAALSRAAAFVGHDSGISHLAAAAGAPSLLLFGPTNPEIWAPRNDGVAVIRASSGDLSEVSPEVVAARTAEILGNS